MNKKDNKAIRVGLFVFIALIIFILTIYFIGSKDNLFSQKTNITCSFQDIRGVVVGNNIRFSGINVGTVKNITMVSDTSVILTLSIADKYTKHIYKNSIVEISQDGLMGNKLLIISSGTPDTGPIEENDHLQAKYGIDLESMLSEARDLLVNANSTAQSLKSIADKVDTGKGDLGRLINDNTLTSELTLATKQLNSTLANVNEITDKINNGKGDLALLINENNLVNQAHTVLSNLNQTADKTLQTVENLETTSNQLNNGEGTLSLLLHSKQTAQNIDTTIIKLQGSLEQFNRTAKAVEESWIVRLFSKKKKEKDGDNLK